MNPREQRTHRTVTGELANTLDAFAQGTINHFSAIERRLTSTEMLLRSQIGEERTHRLKLADEQRAYVDRADKDILRQLHALTDRNLWGRLRWLLIGR